MSFLAPPPRIAVIGGGIAGLAAAHALHRRNQNLAGETNAAGERRIAFDLFEASDRWGGILQTGERDGFLIEHAADMFSIREPWALQLCRELDFEDRLVSTDDRFRRAFVARGDRLHPVPEGFTLMAPSKWAPIAMTPLLGPLGKMRLAAERFVRRRESDDDESFGSFARRRFGREAYERLIQPLIGGIYTADPEQLSMRATLPQFVEMERRHGSIVGAAMSRKNDPAESRDSGARYSAFVAPQRGMGELIARIVDRLPPGSLHLRSPITNLSRIDGKGWRLEFANGRSETYDAILLATSSHVASDLLRSAAPELSASVGELTHASAAIVVAGYSQEALARPLDGFGLVVPAIEGRKILAGSFASVKFPGRAPFGAALTRTFVGGALQADLLEADDAQIIRWAYEDLRSLGVVQGKPLFAEVIRWNRAMPQYHVGHLDRVARIERLVESIPGLALAGNAYRGVGIPFAIRSGLQAAERIVGAALPEGA